MHGGKMILPGHAKETALEKEPQKEPKKTVEIPVGDHEPLVTVMTRYNNRVRNLIIHRRRM